MAHYLGIDLHKKFSYWTLMNEKRDILFQNKVTTTEKDTVEALKKLPVAPSEIQAAIEPVSQWGWYAELLEKEGVKVKLVDSIKTRLIAESRLKNDKVDSGILAELLRSDFLPTAYLAPRETRELREFLRWRMFLVKMKTRVKNRIHGILAKHGINQPFHDLFSKKGLVWLETQELRPVFKAESESLLRGFKNLQDEIKILDKEIKRRVSLNEEAQILSSMPGIGSWSALMIQAEVGDFNRFASPEKLASYAGLVSSSYSSGGNLRLGRITKRGSRHLRSVMVEATLMVSPSWKHLFPFYERIKEKKGAKTARVALARKMLTTLWWMVKKKEPFRDLSSLSLGNSLGVKR